MDVYRRGRLEASRRNAVNANSCRDAVWRCGSDLQVTSSACGYLCWDVQHNKGQGTLHRGRHASTAWRYLTLRRRGSRNTSALAAELPQTHPSCRRPVVALHRHSPSEPSATVPKSSPPNTARLGVAGRVSPEIAGGFSTCT